MTTASGLPAVRESLHLALGADPTAGPEVMDTAAAAVEHYALGYSKHPPHVLFAEVRGVRELLAVPLAHQRARDARELRRILGWLSALLGNLAFHLDDHTGAHVHLATATQLAQRIGDDRLTSWSLGARSMTARAGGHMSRAVELARRGAASAPDPFARAQLLGWALLPALAARGDAEATENTRREADDAFDAAGREEAGRFGYDLAEHRLHMAEAYLTVGQRQQAARLARASADVCVVGTPGWAAATLLLARSEAATVPGDAAARALEVLDRVPGDRLRSTSRTRLFALRAELSGAGVDSAVVRDLYERATALPAPIGVHGQPAT